MVEFSTNTDIVQIGLLVGVGFLIYKIFNNPLTEAYDATKDALQKGSKYLVDEAKKDATQKVRLVVTGLEAVENARQKADNSVKSVKSIVDNTNKKVKVAGKDDAATYNGWSGVLNTGGYGYSVRQENAVGMAKDIATSRPVQSSSVLSYANGGLTFGGSQKSVFS